MHPWLNVHSTHSTNTKFLCGVGDKDQDSSFQERILHAYTLRVCLFGEILGRMENLKEKSGERSFSGCLVGRKSRKKCGRT